MQIEIWSDVVCPWCYIGKRRLETALADFDHADEVEVHWRSFELTPGAPVPPVQSVTDHLAEKYGGGPDQIAQMQERVTTLAAAEGLDYRLDDTMHVATRDAHRLLHLAHEEGGAAVQGALKERLLEDYFVRALDVSAREVLEAAAAAVGLPEEEVAAVLDSDRYDAEVSADIQQARAYGANGVPFFVIDERYGISGAQPVEMFAGALRQAWDASHPTLETFGGDDSSAEVCGPDGCELPQR